MQVWWLIYRLFTGRLHSQHAAYANNPRDEALEKLIARIAAMPIWRDIYPDGPDIMDGPVRLTPNDVRLCRSLKSNKGKDNE